MTDDQRERDEQERLFYALIGYRVMRYQSIELSRDSLRRRDTVEREKSGAIYRVAKGLEAKLDIITAAFIGADDDHAAKWGRLRGRIAAAARAAEQGLSSSSIGRAPRPR